MSREIRGELRTWGQYFLIALVAELSAFTFFFHVPDDTSYQLSGFLRYLWETYEQPRIIPWLVVFLFISDLRFLIVYFTRRSETQI
jgi:hypothetical protein